MDIMNLIHDICLTENRINNIPRWKFISKNKEKERLNKLKSEFMELDIFSIADNTISFLMCFDDETIHNNITGFIQSSNTFVIIMVQDDNKINTRCLYLPKSNLFDISNKNTAYTIYRNTKISNRINKMWEPLTDKIKQRYLDIIIEMAKYLN